MAILATIRCTIGFAPDGGNQMTQQMAQSIVVVVGPTAMPGGNTASVANLNTLATNLGSALQTALAAAQPQINGWPTGGL